MFNINALLSWWYDGRRCCHVQAADWSVRRRAIIDSQAEYTLDWTVLLGQRRD